VARLIHLSVAILLLAAQAGLQGLTAQDASGDFEALWKYVDENYAYFDDKLTRWAEVRSLYRPRLDAVQTKTDLIALFEAMLSELYDSHAHLTVNTADSPPLIPSGTDLWAGWQDARAVVLDVRRPSSAADAGIRVMDEIATIDGLSVASAIESRIGRSLRAVDDRARSWALRVALAGKRNAPREIGISRPGGARSIRVLPLQNAREGDALLAVKTLPGGVGYIKIADSLGEADLIREFDTALARLRNTSALILDLRNTPSGGNTTVARGILGRFVSKESPYQRHVLVGEERLTGVRRSWLELVSPRGPFTYRKRVMVLVNHWTGSMGEGLAIGFDATGAGTIVGTEMSGLLGATYHFELPHSKIGVNLPAERLTHVNGTPREDFRPPVYVSPAVLAASDGDPILDSGMRQLQRKRSKRGA
jgi:C-terminal processing protease CtpA/Prc